jgi:hypothetical protein
MCCDKNFVIKIVYVVIVLPSQLRVQPIIVSYISLSHRRHTSQSAGQSEKFLNSALETGQWPG